MGSLGRKARWNGENAPKLRPRRSARDSGLPTPVGGSDSPDGRFQRPCIDSRHVDATTTAPPAPGPDDVQPVANETRDRLITGTITVVPFVALVIGVWLAWHSVFFWSDLIVFLILYTLTALGITVGFHRLFTHRSFATTGLLRATFAILGSAAIEGPVISWVSDHRKHHAFSDQPGDPHSPHVDHGHGWRGALRGLLHAHVGWLFIHTQRGAKARYAPDLIADPVITRIDRPSSSGPSAACSPRSGSASLIGGTWTRGADRAAVGRRRSG